MQTLTSETLQSIHTTSTPIWIWLPVLLLLLFGVWKLGKLLVLAMRG